VYNYVVYFIVCHHWSEEHSIVAPLYMVCVCILQQS